MHSQLSLNSANKTKIAFKFIFKNPFDPNRSTPFKSKFSIWFHKAHSFVYPYAFNTQSTHTKPNTTNAAHSYRTPPTAIRISLLQSNQFSIFNIFIDLFKIMVVVAPGCQHYNQSAYNSTKLTIQPTIIWLKQIFPTGRGKQFWRSRMRLLFDSIVRPSQTNSYHSERIIIPKH